MDRLWQNVKDVTRSVTVVKTLKTLVALIVIVLITGACGTLKVHQTNKIELTKTRLVNQMADIYNNAGNIEVGQGFAGETGETYANGRFVVFDSPQMGLRAIFRDLRTKIAKHDGVLWSIISEYAPPSENNTELYFKHAKMALNGDDMVGEYTLPKLVKAMVKHENKKEVSDYYLSDPKILQEAFALSTMSFDKGTSYEEAKEIYRQEPLHLSQHVPEHLKY
jgi:hypothetical protein